MRAIDNFVYVCDMGNKRICKINIETNEQTEYLKFEEPTWEYNLFRNKEIGDVIIKLFIQLRPGCSLIVLAALRAIASIPHPFNNRFFIELQATTSQSPTKVSGHFRWPDTYRESDPS